VHVISGVLKNYEWGSSDALRPWTDGPAPLAELWFGIHPSGVSPIVGQDGPLLNSVLQPQDVPILVKLLAAAKPLSVQVHPAAEFAHRGFHHLNSEGAFADANEKTELLYALTDFTAFAGWRDFEQVLSVFTSLSDITGINFFQGVQRESSMTRQEAFSHLVRHGASLPHLTEVIASIPAACATAKIQIRDYAIEAYATVAREFPRDSGALLTLFMNVVQLAPGESIYVPPGVPHSYIHGTGIEVMTSSDNVLRLGLTPKPVFAELALEAIDFTQASLNVPRPFSVEVISSPDKKSVSTGIYRLILAIENNTTVRLEGFSGSPTMVEDLLPGQAAVLTSTDPAAEITTAGRVAIVTLDTVGT
jgi:mannose-6-phosphate isomerase